MYQRSFTHFVNSNIFRSSGSPDRRPSMKAKEWQEAMQRMRYVFESLSSFSFLSMSMCILFASPMHTGSVNLKGLNKYQSGDGVKNG